MRVDVTLPILSYKGEPVTSGEGKEKQTFKIRDAISLAVNSPSPKKQLTAEEKNKVYQISTKIWATKKYVNLSIDHEIPFILKRAGESVQPLTYGRLCGLFDKPEDEPQNEEDGEDTKTDEGDVWDPDK